MTIYTLYVKTHRKTGLKYLGQTSQDPFKYSGSGTDWKTHIKEFGSVINTEILLQTPDKEERNRLGRYYSALWHVVTAADDFGNKLWANKIPETGGGDGRKPGFKMRAESKDKSRKSQTGKKQSLETRQKKSTSAIERFKNNPQWNKGIKTTDLYSEEERKKMFGQPGSKNPMYGVEVPKKECPHCGKTVDIRNYSRYHGDNCKLR